MPDFSKNPAVCAIDRRRFCSLSFLLFASLALGACGSSRPDISPSDRVPSLRNAEVELQFYIRDAVIDELELPEAASGDGRRTYSLTPDLPAGISFNSTTRELSGTPTETLDETTFTYTVSDKDGDTDSLTFAISVSSIRVEADRTEIAEWNDPGAEITVSLSKPAPRRAIVRFAMTGTATDGGDYELTRADVSGSVPAAVSGAEVAMDAGADSATISLRGIPDFDGEGTESIEIAVDSVDSNRFDDSGPAVKLDLLDAGAMFADAKQRLTSAILVFFERMRQTENGYEFGFSLLNLGAATNAPTTLMMRIDFEDFAPGHLIGAPLVSERVDVPALAPQGFASATLKLPNEVVVDWGPGIYTATALITAPPDDFFTPKGGFAEQTSILIPAGGRSPFECEEFNRPVSPETEDPLLSQQWNLNNTGQTAFALAGGVAGEDLRMNGTLLDGPIGSGIEVAVVDTGLEICHPDLKDNVAEGASYNFNTDTWRGSIATDPFNPSASGDHGTSVAGLIAATADNGIGMRGVAPGARLRGYNLLSAIATGDDATLEYDALGASTSNPDSSSAHIFNMSYGLVDAPQSNASQQAVAVFRNGVDKLRGGRGALYVKAAGNFFDLCLSLVREHRFEDRGEMYSPNHALGCASANIDAYNNLPYLITVGAFNAHGEHASYSSVGSNLWVSAPAGEGGFFSPAMVTTDQAGPHRGEAGLGFGRDPFADPVEEEGDYTSAFGGTSSAAPNTAGAIALMLEVNPQLTWRDVKHILARTARMIDPGVEPVRIAFCGKPAVLQHGWITNAAGYNFHNWYGFGAVNVDAALEFARGYTADSLGEFARTTFEHAASETIPDNDGGGIEQIVTVSGFSATANVEAAELEIRAAHPFPHDLGVTLVSPAGTESILNPVYNDPMATEPQGLQGWSLLSNAFYGESPNGDWTLRVIDAASGDIGSLDAWALTLSVGEHP